MVSRPGVSGALAEFADCVRVRFGTRLRHLVLFGSHARGEATESSDVDVLVVVDDLAPADAGEVDALVGDLLTRTDVLVSPLLLSTSRYEDLRARERRLVAEIERDGVLV